MAFTPADWSIAANGDIRYIGDAHVPAGTNPSYATVIEFHRALQDFADNEAASGDDLLDISSLTPSERSTDNIITLLNNFNIDQTGSEHLYDGSIIQDNGDDIWDGIVNFGNASYINLHQDGTTVLNNFWNDNTPQGFNSNANAGISHRFLVQTRNGGVDVDGRRLLGLVREYGKTYSEFPINGTSRGNNVLALSEANDLNNTTSGAVIGALTIANIKEGYNAIDVNNDGTDEFYYSQWDLAGNSINDFYEFTKFITRRGNTSSPYGLSGDLFRGITHQIGISSPSGTFVEPEALTWTGGTGQLFAIDSTTAGTVMYIQLLTGIAPPLSQIITGANGAFATAGVVIARPISNVFSGLSTGSSLIGSYGLGIEAADLSSTDKVFDLDNVEINPPNNVSFSVLNLVVGEDRVMVGPADQGGLLNKSQLAVDISLNGQVETQLTVNTAIPSDTPASGTIRIVNDSGFDRPVAYASFSGSVFTFTGAEAFNGTEENAAASAGQGVYITYIDKLAAATTETFTVVYSADRSLFVRVRDGGATPIRTFETPATIGSAGGSVTIIRTTDL